MKCSDIQTAYRKAMVNYACCEESTGELALWADTMDIIDEYEVCLDVAAFSKGSREMSWTEFGTYRDELHNFLNGLQNAPATQKESKR